MTAWPHIFLLCICTAYRLAFAFQGHFFGCGIRRTPTAHSRPSLHSFCAQKKHSLLHTQARAHTHAHVDESSPQSLALTQHNTLTLAKLAERERLTSDDYPPPREDAHSFANLISASPNPSYDNNNSSGSESSRDEHTYTHSESESDNNERCLLVAVDRTTECVKVQQEALSRAHGHALPPDLAGETAALSFTESLQELRELVRTAEMTIEGVLVQRLSSPNPLTYIGSGKLRELAAMINASLTPISAVVLDDDLSPRQQRAVEDALTKHGVSVKVLDRTALILRIFVQHAKSREAQLQVELATLQYHLNRGPKLMGKVEHESMRGKGETERETQHRVVKERMRTIREALAHLEKQRELERAQRKHRLHSVPFIALVGYTNAGKSSLMNVMSDANVLAENKLFATLDTTTRKIVLPKGRERSAGGEDNEPLSDQETLAEDVSPLSRKGPEVLVTDTVGFISKLPHNLVSAFRSTLDTVRHADVLVLVVDRASPRWQKERETVLRELHALGCEDTPIIEFWNKIDLIDELGRESVRKSARERPMEIDAVVITGRGDSDNQHEQTGSEAETGDRESAVRVLEEMEETEQAYDRTHYVLENNCESEEDRGLAEAPHHHRHNREHKESDLRTLSPPDQFLSAKKHKHTTGEENAQRSSSPFPSSTEGYSPTANGAKTTPGNGKTAAPNNNKKGEKAKEKKEKYSSTEEELLSLVWNEEDEFVRFADNSAGAGSPPMANSDTSSVTSSNHGDETLEVFHGKSPRKHYTVAASALTGDGMDEFYSVLNTALALFLKPITVFVPFREDQSLITQIHRHGEVDDVEYHNEGTKVKCRVPEALWNKLKAFEV